MSTGGKAKCVRRECPEPVAVSARKALNSRASALAAHSLLPEHRHARRELSEAGAAALVHRAVRPAGGAGHAGCTRARLRRILSATDRGDCSGRCRSADRRECALQGRPDGGRGPGHRGAHPNLLFRTGRAVLLDPSGRRRADAGCRQRRGSSTSSRRRPVPSFQVSMHDEGTCRPDNVILTGASCRRRRGAGRSAGAQDAGASGVTVDFRAPSGPTTRRSFTAPTPARSRIGSRPTATTSPTRRRASSRPTSSDNKYFVQRSSRWVASRQLRSAPSS